MRGDSVANQRRPVQLGEAAPAFTLPSANRDGAVALADLRGRPFLIAFYRGLHCPFCRRQLVQLSAAQPALLAAGIETLAVINTPLDRARTYFRYRPTPVTLLSDPDCVTHAAFGVPRGEFLPEGSSESPKWPYQATMELFMAARVNPTGELPEKVQPMEANVILNAKDGFEMQEADHAIFANHPTQLVGHFLVDAEGIVRWVHIEAPDDPNNLCIFPTAADLVAAASSLTH
jgi:peroxiredoxin